MAGQNCPIVQKEKFLDDLSNKQVLITGICWLQQFFGVWEIADRGLGLLLLWLLSLAVGKDLVDWELLGGEFVILIYFCFLESWAWELFLILLLFLQGGLLAQHYCCSTELIQPGFGGKEGCDSCTRCISQ